MPVMNLERALFIRMYSSIRTRFRRVRSTAVSPLTPKQDVLCSLAKASYTTGSILRFCKYHHRMLVDSDERMTRDRGFRRGVLRFEPEVLAS